MERNIVDTSMYKWFPASLPQRLHYLKKKKINILVSFNLLVFTLTFTCLDTFPPVVFMNEKLLHSFDTFLAKRTGAHFLVCGPCFLKIIDHL